MKRKWLIRILLASLAIGTVAGSYLYTRHQTDAQAEAGEAALQQAVASLGSLTISVTGTGELAPASTVELGFEESGVLVELLVNAGDEVKAGDVLARLQTDKSTTQHAADVAAAELAVLKAEQALDQLHKNAQIESAQALLAVEQAQHALEDLSHDELEQALAQQAVAQAEEDIETAEMSLYILNSSPSDQAIYTAYASLLFKAKELGEMEKRIARLENQIKNAPDKKTWEQLRRELRKLNLELIQMQGEYENRVYLYEHLNDPSDSIDLSVAEAQLATAKEELAQAEKAWEVVQKGPSTGEIAAAQAALLEAEATWERLNDGPDPQEVVRLETELEIARAQLAEVKAEKLILDLVAPIDGTVLEVNATAGDRLGTETLITLADLSQIGVEVYVDETDLKNIQAGNGAQVIFDALPDEVFTGRVVLVDPSLVDSWSASSGRAWIQVDVSSPMSQMLPVGLNASVDIITGSVDQALLVPVEALHQTDSEGYVVYVIHGEALEQRSVTVGLMDLTSAEILDGLEAGEIIALGDI
jgi:HlyD family secretion protein